MSEALHMFNIAFTTTDSFERRWNADKMMSYAYNRFVPSGQTWRSLFDMVGNFSSIRAFSCFETRGDGCSSWEATDWTISSYGGLSMHHVLLKTWPSRKVKDKENWNQFAFRKIALQFEKSRESCDAYHTTLQLLEAKIALKSWANGNWPASDIICFWSLWWYVKH